MLITCLPGPACPSLRLSLPICPAPLLPAVYSARNGLLYTINCQCSELRWEQNQAAFRKAAETFTILNSGAATAGFPDRL